MERDYQEAIRCLNSRKAAAKPKLDDMRGSDDMKKWLELLGYELRDLDDLNVIHVAGTNGKGSTCAFAASFLSVCGSNTGYPQSIGLYTSPHMRNIRERICINGEPISEQFFTSVFFEIWDKLPKVATATLDYPRYLQLCTLISMLAFKKARVDVAIYETHCGGEYDATNIFKKPLVTVITSISMDHVRVLGPALQDIAWHKAGIFKLGSLAFSALQAPEVETVLNLRAARLNTVVRYVGVNSNLPTNAIALKSEAQRMNCSLALEAVNGWLSAKAPLKRFVTAAEIICGIELFSCPGRYQQIQEGKDQWFLDGAHNALGLKYAVTWFAEMIMEDRDETVPLTRILIFSHFSDRDGTSLLQAVAKHLKSNKVQIQNVIFSTYTEKQGQARIDRNLEKRFSPATQEQYVKAWKEIDPVAKISCERTIEGALCLARKIAGQNKMQALVTGSLHLVSGALHLLDDENSAHL